MEKGVNLVGPHASIKWKGMQKKHRYAYATIIIGNLN